MFGLMRARKCGMSAAEKHFRRLNYCGTCKTTGALYEQKARFLLNHDAVFLAEILSALSGENVGDWQASYQSFNCLSLPGGEMPKSLQFAATTNVILTEFKLADHVADERKKRYRFAQKAFSEEFQKAEKLLESWHFPLLEVKEILQTQTARENAKVGKSATHFLNDCAAPTAETTAIFFREGVGQIGRSDLQKTAFALGFSFGKLIYLLDAFEDYEKDFRARQFNAIRTAFDLKNEKISPEAKRKIVSLLHELETKIGEKIKGLPIAENQKTLFVTRLSSNLQRKLKTDLPIVETQKTCAPKPSTTFDKRWQNASEKARTFARNYSWQMPLVFIFIFVFAFVAPPQSREAKSARECFDLSFNLMFLGAIFGSVVSFPALAMQNLPAENIEDKIERKRRWCDSCDCCDCCDSCCCCCDCGDCDCNCCDC